MFLEIIQPQLVDLYATRDKIKLRIMETGAPGRLWVNLTFENMEQAKTFVAGLQKILEGGVTEYMKSKEKKID